MTPSESEEPKLCIVADTHFGHANIIKYCNRPFANVDEMNEELIRRWNAVVNPQDTVLHLGDVGFHYSSLFKIIPRLNGGLKRLVRGNHDWSTERMEALGFQCVTNRRNDVFSQPYNNRMLICTHRPRDLPTWNPEKLLTFGNRNIVLCGHEHDNAPHFIKWVRDKRDKARPVMGLNISIEHTGYAPVTIDRLCEIYDNFLQPYLDKLGIHY